MEWLVSAGLLVALAAWVTGVCHRLQLLRTELRSAWTEWLSDTHRRNETLGAFTEAVSLLLPPGEMLPRTLRRLLGDSERCLQRGESLLWSVDEARHQTELELLHEADGAARRVEETAALRGDEGLRALCERLLSALERQEQSGNRFRMVAESYNAALREPPVQLLAPALGFRCVPPR